MKYITYEQKTKIFLYDWTKITAEKYRQIKLCINLDKIIQLNLKNC